jgi:dipeptidyl aminopeptidase/acylaminoacyl peptidase
LWHTSDDATVNVKNSLIFAERMRDAGVPFELHVFPHGKHGLGLAPDHDDVRQWADLAADWVERNI